MPINPQQRGAIIGLIGDVLQSLDHTFLGIGDLIQTIVQACTRARAQLRALSSFTFDPKFKTRVINVPKAEEGAKNLYFEIRHVLIDKFTEVEGLVQQTIETLRHGGELHEPGEPALAGAAVFLQEVHAFILNVGNLITKVLDLGDILVDIKQRIEGLDDLFLQQGNTKKVVDEHYRKRQRS